MVRSTYIKHLHMIFGSTNNFFLYKSIVLFGGANNETETLFAVDPRDTVDGTNFSSFFFAEQNIALGKGWTFKWQ